jgi:hypothetical protein
VLRASDGSTLTVPAPADASGRVLSGPGWRLELAPGWVVRPGARPGDLQVVPEGGDPGKRRYQAGSVGTRRAPGRGLTRREDVGSSGWGVWDNGPGVGA